MEWCGWCGEIRSEGAHGECDLALRDLYEDRATAAEVFARLDDMAGLPAVAESHRERAVRLREAASKALNGGLRVALFTLAFGALTL